MRKREPHFVKKSPALAVALLVVSLFILSGCFGSSSTAKSKNGPDLESMSAQELEKKGDEAARSGKEREALVYYASAMDKGADKSLVNYKIGGMFMGKEEWKKALAAYKAAVAAQNEFPAALYGAGYASFMLEDNGAAEAYLKKALEFAPGMVPSASLLGVVYNKDGKPGEAIPVLEQALKVTPDNPELLNNLGIAKFMAGDFEGAAEAFQASLKVTDATRTRNNLGLALCGLRRYDEAFAAFTAAGSEASALNNLGACYERAGDAQKAREYYEKAVEANPRFYIKASENLTRLNAGQPPAPHPEAGAPVGN